MKGPAAQSVSLSMKIRYRYLYSHISIGPERKEWQKNGGKNNNCKKRIDEPTFVFGSIL